MKLPQINYNTGTTSLGRFDLGGVDKMEQAKRGVAKAVGQLSNTVAEGVQKYQLSDAKLAVKSEMSDFEANFKGKHFYTSEELADSGNLELVNLGRDRDLVPASEVYPTLYEEAYKKSIKEHGNSLVGRWSRNYEEATSFDMFNNVASNAANAMSQMSKEHDAEIGVNIAEDQQNGNFDIAAERIDMLANVTDADRRSLHVANTNKGKVHGIDKLLLDENPIEIRAERDRLNEVEYDTDYKDIVEQRKQRDRLDAWLYNFDSASRGYHDTAATNLKAMMRKMAANVADGHDASADDVQYVEDALTGMSEKDIPTHLRDTYYDALKSYSVSQRNRELSVLDSNSKMVKMMAPVVGFRNEEVNRRSIKLMGQQNKEKADNPIGFYNKGNNPTIPRVSLFEGEEAFSIAWESRFNEDAAMVNDRYKTGTKNFRYFDDVEAQEIAATLNSEASDDGIIRIAKSMYGISGRKTAGAIDELRTAGELNPRLSVIGSLVARSPLGADGTPTLHTARNLVEGAEIRAVHKWVIPKDEWRDSFVEKMYPKFNSAYAGDREYQDAVMDTVLDAYAYLAKDNLEEFNDELIDKAIEMATGGLAEWGDSTFQAPYDSRMGRTINQAEVNDWLKHMHSDELGRTGGAMNYTNDALKLLIEDEEITFEYAGDDKFYLKNTNTNGKNLPGYIRGNDGGRYVLEYNSNYILDTDKAVNSMTRVIEGGKDFFDENASKDKLGGEKSHTQWLKDRRDKIRKENEAAEGSRIIRQNQRGQRGPRK